MEIIPLVKQQINEGGYTSTRSLIWIKKRSPEPNLSGGCTHPTFKKAKNGLLVLLGDDTRDVAAIYSAGVCMTHFYGLSALQSLAVDFEWSAFNPNFL